MHLETKNTQRSAILAVLAIILMVVAVAYQLGQQIMTEDQGLEYSTIEARSDTAMICAHQEPRPYSGRPDPTGCLSVGPGDAVLIKVPDKPDER